MEEKDYRTLTADEAIGEIERVSGAVHRGFGALSVDQLNWKPSATQWSVGECLEHLITANSLYFAIVSALHAGKYPRPLLSRLPGYAGFFGKLLIQAVSPQTVRKVKTAAVFEPKKSTVDADEVARFAEHQADLVGVMRESQSLDLSRTMIASPVSSAIVYSLMDAWRLIAAHEVRHLGQARRVTQTPGFPTA